MNEKIQEFITTQVSEQDFPRSLWFRRLKGFHLDVYLRAGPTYSYNISLTNPVRLHALCIANIEVSERWRRKGNLTRFVDELTALGKELGYTELQIENAQSQEMIAFCVKRGYQVKRRSEYTISDCFYTQI